LLHRFLHLFAVDRAVAVAVLGRLWQSFAGLLTLFFILRFFTPTIQGYFQTFLSLIALQAFVELGLLGVIVVVVSHEWAGLEFSGDGTLIGDDVNLRRLSSILRFVAAWFAAAALILLVVGGLAGIIVLLQHGDPRLWIRPWITTVGLASALLLCQSFVAILEGANRIFEVAVYRFVQAGLSSVALWTAAALGIGLWSIAAQLLTGILCALVFIGGIYRKFFSQLMRMRGPSTFKWRGDVWPMQWQLALQGVAGYFSASFLVPVIYSYYGPIEAGRMGLSVQVVQAMGALAASWLTVALPRLGAAFAKGQISRFEKQWLQSCTASFVALLMSAIAVIAVVLVGTEKGVPALARFLPPLPFALLVLWAVALNVVQCCTLYWRAQRVELLRFWGIVPGLTTGVAVWYFGSRFGVVGAAAGLSGVALFIFVPMCTYLFARSRQSVRRLRLTGTDSGRRLDRVESADLTL
jgi:O-antigen/teichoic acid export membrane protein